MGDLQLFLRDATFDSNRDKVGLSIYYFHTYAGEDTVTPSDVRDLFNINEIPMSCSIIAGHIQNLKEEELLTDIKRGHSREYCLTPDGIRKFERLAGEGTTTQPVDADVEIDLDEALAQGESERIEFKEEIPDSRRDIPKEAAALANKRGGILVYGVDDDDNSVVGIPDVDDVEELVENLLRNNVEPKIDFSIEKIARNGDDVLVVRVPSAEELPRSLGGIHYIRIGTSVRKMTGPELREWFSDE